MNGLQPTQNALLTTSYTIPSSGITAGAVVATVNTLTFGNANLTFGNANDTLVITAGGINGANPNNPQLGTVANQGFVTTGTGQQELFIHKQNNTLTINAIIKDNGSPLNVVIDSMSSGGGGVTINSANTYTGTTYVNGINVSLNTQAGGPAIAATWSFPGAPAMPAKIRPDSRHVQQRDAKCRCHAGPARQHFQCDDQRWCPSELERCQSDHQKPHLHGGWRLELLQRSADVKRVGPPHGDRDDPATNLVDSTVIPSINGNISLTNATRTITVDANSSNPGTIGLAINAAISTPNNGTISTGFTKAGLGVLGIGSVTGDFGQLDVIAGGVAISANNAIIGSRVNLKTPARSSTPAG